MYNYYCENSPTLVTNAFSNINTQTIMVTSSYLEYSFGTLNVSNTTIDECFPPTLTFTKSNTFTQLDTFIKSNAFEETFIYDSTFSYSMILTYTFSNIELFSFLRTYLMDTYMLSIIDSINAYIYTEFVHFEYTVVIYLTYFNFYSDFYTIFQHGVKIEINNTIIYIVIDVVIVVIIIITLLIVLLVRLHRRNNKISSEEAI